MICYVNGYNGENSKKPQKLEKLLNIPIKHIKYIYEKHQGDAIKKLYDELDDNGCDIIIASSTGAYIVRDYCFERSVILIALNPVINIETTFKKLGVKIPNIPKHNYRYLLEQLIFVNKDDELIDYKKTQKLLHNVVVFEKGGHRFDNLEETVPHIENLFKYALCF